MKLKPYFLSLISTAILCLAMMAFSGTTAYSQASSNEAGPIRSSPAYSEILLRKTEILSDLEAFSSEYTEANPKMLDLRSELASLDKMLERVFGVKPSDTGKLTLALGKMIVRKAVLDADLARLARSYNKDHPDVKRAARKAEIYDAAIKEVLR